MKKLACLILTIVSLFAFNGCKNGEEMQIDDNFHPRIFDNNGVFIARTRVINQGQSAVYNGLTFSPKPFEKTKIVWKVDGQQVSTDTAYTFTPTAGGEYELRVEATYNGQTSTRISNILVSPDTYTPKDYTHVIMAYLSENGKATDIDWSKVTHVAFNGARVISSTAIDYSKGNTNQNIDEIVARGHINGVPVLLGITGRLSGIDGWSLYNSTDFGLSINTADKRATLIENIKTYVANRKLDGVDIMMTDLGNDSYDVSAEMTRSVAPFLNELKAALPAGAIVTATVTVNYLHWEYLSLMAADWINVHAFEDGLTVGPGAPRGQPSSLQFMIDAANIWVNTKGYPKDKLVIGIPAFGLRYDAIDANGNNLSWGSYGYMMYKDIVAADASAPQNEHTDKIAQGAYYNGLPLVTQKADYIKTNGFKGAYLWAEDYDVAGTSSLLNVVSNKLK
ncbi:hypothetical protein FW774_18370 [Pedobacter sp. BS3]|uniref:glycosyl hydrolase family 18 protein n=1 Tax=Pedobacter sp. BS3 TaxID=2567937 RepID=UPI0011EC3217|nr:glycosyl hydrolase family 18 protein [Pedobacter sp. BS3]TZF81518.1 hypothetical protein FW774_18370 [Pedobacter sp. BS3]